MRRNAGANGASDGRVDPRGKGVERAGQAGGQRTADRPLRVADVPPDLQAETGERRRSRIGGGDARQPQLGAQLGAMGARQRTELGAQLGPAGPDGIGIAIGHGTAFLRSVRDLPALEIVRGGT